MFNLPSDFGVPGFRVRQPDDMPGFRIDENGLPDRGYVLASGDAPSPDPLRQAVDRASGGSPSPDPLRQAVDRAAGPSADRGAPTTSLSAAQIGGLIGGFLGGTAAGLLTRNPHITRAGTAAGTGLGYILGGEYGNGNAGRAISAVNNSGLAGVPGM
jgi:hypothetical protein